MPEKFGRELFKKLGIKFETQQVFEWSDGKVYDFYIPSLHLLIESHGLQHYEEVGLRRPILEEMINDALKLENALLNNFTPEQYVVVDCRYSTFEHLKENYNKSLLNHFDLSEFDWVDLWLVVNNINYKNQVWEAWNNKKEEDSSTTLAKIFNLSSHTIVKWLKDGSIVGKCDYNPKEESIKGKFRNAGALNKAIGQYDLFTGELIQIWKSNREVGRIIGIHSSNISACIHGKIKHAGGFIWKFIANIEEEKVVEVEEIIADEKDYVKKSIKK